MGLYQGIKDVANVVQKADNIELYKKLLDLSAQALDMQAEIAQLKEENAELRKGQDLESRIVRHDQPFLTIEGEADSVRYCAVCWGKDKKLIQLRCQNHSGAFECSVCKTQGIFNEQIAEAHSQEQLDAIRRMQHF